MWRVPSLVKVTKAPVFRYIFNLSLEQKHVSRLWKTSTIIPMPKKQAPKVCNDYRLVALTPVVIKCFDSCVQADLTSYLQFRKARSTVDVTACCTHCILQHLENP